MSPVTSPVEALDLTLHFGSIDTLAWVFEEIFAKEPYAVSLSNATPTIFDGGANIGLSVLYFKRRFPGATVVAFEPAEANFELLEQNIAANSVDGVTCHRVALGAEEGTGEFRVEARPAGSLVGSVGGAGMREFLTATETVQVRRLSSYLESTIDLLKLDVEGAEGAVVQELAESGKFRLIERMIVEFHHHLGVGSLSLAAFLTLIESEGFDYQLIADSVGGAAREPGAFEDVLIYAYRNE